MSPPLDSRDLLDRAQRGEGPAFDDLLARLMPDLRAYLRLVAGPAIRARESCSDLAQSVCREILQDLEAFEYRGEAAFRHWVFTTALRKVQDRARFYGREKRDIARERPMGSDAGEIDQVLEIYRSCASPSRQAMAREEMAQIEELFDALPENYREIIVMAKISGLSHKEIATHLGKSEAYSRTLLARALARLARLAQSGG